MSDRPDTVSHGPAGQFIELGAHYARPPIDEAVIEFRVRPREDATVESLLDAVSINPEWNRPERAFSVQGNVEISGDSVRGDTSTRHVGFLHQRTDGARAIQVHTDTLAYSWTGAYEDWDHLLAEAWTAWVHYRNSMQPLSVIGLGVRYVNRILMPKRQIEIKDYLRTSVDISPYLPQAVIGMVSRVDVPFEDYRCLVSVTTALTQTPAEATGPLLLLDIDAKRRLEDHPAGDDKGLLEALADLRNAKNYTFEACITDATRGLMS